MKRVGLWAAAVVAVVWLVFVECTAILWANGLLEPRPETYVIDAKKVVRIFTEERGKDLSEEDMVKAISVIDQLVTAKAEEIYRDTGSVIVNKNHMLAGGKDVSNQFAALVISAWDDTQ